MTSHRSTEQSSDGTNGTDNGINRDEIALKLRDAGVLIGNKPDVEDLMVDAYLAFGGLPSRIVHPGEDAHPLPDFTASEEGRRLLAELENEVLVRTHATSESAGEEST